MPSGWIAVPLMSKPPKKYTIAEPKTPIRIFIKKTATASDCHTCKPASKDPNWNNNDPVHPMSPQVNKGALPLETMNNDWTQAMMTTQSLKF